MQAHLLPLENLHSVLDLLLYLKLLLLQVIGLLVQLELTVLFLDLSHDLLRNVEQLGSVTCILRKYQVVNLIADVRANVHQVAGAFVSSRVTESLLHHLLLVDLERPMVIVLPPAFLYPVVNVRIVVAILSQPIVDQNSVQLVWPLLVLNVWGRDDVLEFLDFLLESLDLLFSRFLVLLQNCDCNFHLILFKLHVAVV